MEYVPWIVYMVLLCFALLWLWYSLYRDLMLNTYRVCPKNYEHGFVNSLWPSGAIWHCRCKSNIGSGNGLVPDGTKPLPEPILTYHLYHWILILMHIFYFQVTTCGYAPMDNHVVREKWRINWEDTASLSSIKRWPTKSACSGIYLSQEQLSLMVSHCVSYALNTSRSREALFFFTIELVHPRIILFMRSAKERWRYIVTSSLIGWAHTQNALCS